MFFNQPIAHPPKPVFTVDLRGRVQGAESLAVRPGTSTLDTVTGRIFVMTGGRGGLMVEDAPQLELTKSVGLSCWVKLDSYPGFASQLIFRGDDRSGLDPYTLVVQSDGQIYFGVQNEKDQGVHVNAPIKLNEWVHVTASLDDNRGAMRLYLDGELVDAKQTTIRPFAHLDAGWAPGLGIGNVQNDRGPHNQPLQGSLADVRIYDQPITPKLVGYQPNGWKYPLLEIACPAE